MLRSVTPPCGICCKPVNPKTVSTKGPGKKKIKLLSCCWAPVCSECHHILLHAKRRCKCVFCKGTNFDERNLVSFRKTSSRIDWNEYYKAYESLQDIFKKNPGLYNFLQVSGPFEYYDSERLLKEYKKFQAHTVSVLSLLAGIFKKRLKSKRRFMKQPLIHLTRCRMWWIFVERFSFLSNYIKLRYPEYQVKGRLIKKCRKYLHFGSVFFITLKLSTMLLDSRFYRVPNAVQLIISRFSKQIEYSCF